MTSNVLSFFSEFRDWKILSSFSTLQLLIIFFVSIVLTWGLAEFFLKHRRKFASKFIIETANSPTSCHCPEINKSNCVFPYEVVSIKNVREYQEDRFCVVGAFNGNMHMTYYAVFDGHGGSSCSDYCASHLHEYLAQSIIQSHYKKNTSEGTTQSSSRHSRSLSMHTLVRYVRTVVSLKQKVCKKSKPEAVSTGSSGVPASDASTSVSSENEPTTHVQSSPSSSSLPVHSNVTPTKSGSKNGTKNGGKNSSESSSESSGVEESESNTQSSTAVSIREMDIVNAFQNCDKGYYNSPYKGGDDGSTVLTVIVDTLLKQIVVAHVGDSRAMIMSAQESRYLSMDHKPDNRGERERIEMSGGHVLSIGVPRVQGVLAVSRALGDYALKPYVSNIPSVSYFPLKDDDEYIVLASDGLWDVVNNEDIRRCLVLWRKEKHSLYECTQRLSQMAVNKSSGDNITVLIVDIGRERRKRMEREQQKNSSSPLRRATLASESFSKNIDLLMNEADGHSSDEDEELLRSLSNAHGSNGTFPGMKLPSMKLPSSSSSSHVSQPFSRSEEMIAPIHSRTSENSDESHVTSTTNRVLFRDNEGSTEWNSEVSQGDMSEGKPNDSEGEARKRKYSPPKRSNSESSIEGKGEDRQLQDHFYDIDNDKDSDKKNASLDGKV